MMDRFRDKEREREPADRERGGGGQGALTGELGVWLHSVGSL